MPEPYYEWNKGSGQSRAVHLFRIVPPATAYPACSCGVGRDYRWIASPELSHLGCESGQAIIKGEASHWIHPSEIQQSG